MAVCRKRGVGKTRQIGAITLLAAILVGCGRQQDGGQADQPAGPGLNVTDAGSPPMNDATRLHLPFGEATITDPPPDDQRLPDRTLTGKSVGKLFVEVSKIWNDIRFLDAAGKPLQYRAVLDTELGPVEIALRPDLAPNHVRSFVALARAGYYDGLVFERTVHAQSPTNPDDKLDLIEAGCPIGTGDQSYGSIGYWLPLEVQDQVLHEEGTIGAAHGEDPDTAACKFYITLGKAPVLDGEFTIFGKVTRGLDVARRILTQPVRNDPEFPENDRPMNPIKIRKVTIQVQEGESLVAK